MEIEESAVVPGAAAATIVMVAAMLTQDWDVLSQRAHTTALAHAATNGRCSRLRHSAMATLTMAMIMLMPLMLMLLVLLLTADHPSTYCMNLAKL